MAQWEDCDAVERQREKVSSGVDDLQCMLFWLVLRFF